MNPTTIGLGNAARSKDRVFFGAKILFAKLITLDIVYSSKICTLTNLWPFFSNSIDLALHL